MAQADTKVTDSTGVELKERKIIIRINLVQAWKGNAIRMCPVTSNKKQELLPEHLSIAIFWLLHNYRGKLLDKSKRGVEQINRTRKNEKSFKHPRRSIMRKCFVSRYKANAAATLEYISIHSSSCTLMQKATGHLCKARITSMDFKCARRYTYMAGMIIDFLLRISFNSSLFIAQSVISRLRSLLNCGNRSYVISMLKFLHYLNFMTFVFFFLFRYI